MTAMEEDREVTGGSASLTRPRAHARVCAVDAVPGELPPQVPSFPRVHAWAASVQAAGPVLLEKPGTLLHSQPPTFRQAHARHAECAQHLSHPALRGSRLAYGHAHSVLVKAPLNYAEWATSSPLGLTVHVLLGLAFWLGLLLGGYL